LDVVAVAIVCAGAAASEPNIAVGDSECSPDRWESKELLALCADGRGRCTESLRFVAGADGTALT
jgi:hypothetical protein